MENNDYKTLEIFIWNLIKDKTEPTYTGTDSNKINDEIKYKQISLKDFEVSKIKSDQLDKLIKILEDKEKERKRIELEAQNAENEAKELEEARIRREDEERRLREKTEVPTIKITEANVSIEEISKPTIPKAKKSYLYPLLAVLGIILLIGGGFFIYNLGKESNSNSDNQPIVLGNTSDLHKEQQISFEQLLGKYEGKVNGKEISIKITLTKGKKEYNYYYSEDSMTVPRPLHYYENLNEINFSRTLDKDLEKCDVVKEGDIIILRSEKDNVELQKIK